MKGSKGNNTMNRRQFISAVGVASAASSSLSAAAQGNSAPAGPAEWPEKGNFRRRDLPLKAKPFPMTNVRLGDGPFKDAQEVNRRVLHQLPADRLLHNFRVNASLPSSAEPLGGWEKPDCELRGHFTGHYLSACALMYASTGDTELKEKAGTMVAELAKCQAALGNGYLSAFPLEFWDRLNARKKVWAPFYTYHKIMAGMLDLYEHCGNRQALEVLEGMAGWADRWSEPLGEGHMQDVLNTEYGGMNEVLLNLYAVTGKERYAEVAHRYDKKKFFDPLALHRDELKGLHVNTHIPQVIGAARRYELTQERRYYEIADYFWSEVTSARSYCTGGTSNAEGWLTEPAKLAEELLKSPNTTECCCAYNMLKLTRHVYQWTADPRYFDYYERTLFNHRLGTINPESGETMYYLPLNAGSRKVFGAEYGSLWCCTGTGVEEYSKLNDSIYFHDDDGVFVNLFIASELNWAEKGVRIRQETKFPEQHATRLIVETPKPVEMALRIRVPWWAARGGAARLNGKLVGAFSNPGSYLTLTRAWKNGDRVEIELPMSLRAEPLPDDNTLQAFLYGPIVLVGHTGEKDLPKDMTTGHFESRAKPDPANIPTLRGDSRELDSWMRPVGDQPLTFRAAGQAQDETLSPLYKLFGQRYTVYFRVNPNASA